MLHKLVPVRGDTSTLKDPKKWLAEAFGFTSSAAGVAVNPDTALQVSTVYRCITLRAGSVGMCPAKLYRRRKSGGKDQISPTSDFLAFALHNLPHPRISPFEMAENIVAQMDLRGTAFFQVLRNSYGEIVGFQPMHPDRTVVELLPDDSLRYIYTQPDGSILELEQHEVWRIPNFGDNGITGRTPIDMARESIGLAKVAEQFGSLWFKNGSRASGVFVHPKGLSDKARENLKKSLELLRGGGAHGIAVLEEGMEWKQLSISPEDAQFLVTRQFQRQDLANFFGVPGMLVGADDKAATYASAEQFMLTFVKTTIGPLVKRIEQAAMRDLLTYNQKGNLEIEFDIEGLQRGDFVARQQGLEIQRRNGVINGNDWARLENRNDYPGGEKYVIQGQYVELEKLGEKPGGSTSTTTEEDDQGTPDKAWQFALAAAQRCVRKEVSAMRRAAQKPAEEFRAEVKTFYADHAAFVRDVMCMSEAAAARYCNTHCEPLLAAADPAHFISACDEDRSAHYLAQLALKDSE